MSNQGRSQGSGGSMPQLSIDPVKVLRQHILGIIITGIIGAGFGGGAHFFFLNFWPIYTAEALFEVTGGLEEATQIGTGNTFDDRIIERLVATQATLITDGNILLKAIQSKEVQNTDWFQTWYVDDDGRKYEQDALEELESSLGTPQYRGTKLFGLRWSTQSKSDLVPLLNEVVRVYEQESQRRQIRDIEKDLEAFKQEEKIFSQQIDLLKDQKRELIQSGRVTVLSEQEMSTVSMEKNRIFDQLSDIRLQFEQAQSGLLQVQEKLMGARSYGKDDTLLAEQDPKLARENQKLQDLKAELASKRELYGERHHAVLNLVSEVSQTEREIQLEIERIVERNLNAQARTYKQQVDTLTQQEESLRRDLEDKERKLQEEVTELDKYLDLEAELEALTVRLELTRALIQDSTRLKQREKALPVRKVSAPQEPFLPLFPRLYYMVPLGLILFVGSFLGLVFFKEITDQKIRSPRDIMITPGTRRLRGAIPDLEEDPTEARKTKKPELIVSEYPDSVLAEIYRQAWTDFSRKLTMSGRSIVMGFSAQPEAGTTTSICSFALAAVASGSKVICIDANFRRTKLADVFEVDANGPGVGDYLSGDADLDSCIQETSQNVDIIGAGTPPSRISERLSDDRISSMLADLRSKYNYIFIDAPPAVVASESLQLGDRVEATYMVVQANRDERGMIGRFARDFGDLKGDFSGVLLNRIQGTAGGYMRKNHEAMVRYNQTTSRSLGAS